MEDFAQIIDLISQMGYSALLLWFLLREMRSHEGTRRAYRDDLRELAGLRQSLTQIAKKSP